MMFTPRKGTPHIRSFLNLGRSGQRGTFVQRAWQKKPTKKHKKTPQTKKQRRSVSSQIQGYSEIKCYSYGHGRRWHLRNGLCYVFFVPAKSQNEPTSPGLQWASSSLWMALLWQLWAAKPHLTTSFPRSSIFWIGDHCWLVLVILFTLQIGDTFIIPNSRSILKRI